MLKARAIEMALRRPAPSSIPLSGPRAADNDFYAVYVEFPNDAWKVLIAAAEARGYSGRLWIDEREGREYTILKSALARKDSQICIEHYFRGWQFNYRSALAFIVAYALRWHRVKILKDRLLQDIYNRRTLIRAERMELLRYLVELTVADRRAEFDPLTLGIKLHSTRWFYHPQRDEHRAHLKLIMESLVSTSDLTAKDGRYAVAPQALATLAEFEQEERRHSDSINTSRTANRLSRAIILVGILAMAVQLFTWWMGPRP
jgi:hypothetical protein